jgi:hypothetical protein
VTVIEERENVEERERLVRRPSRPPRSNSRPSHPAPARYPAPCRPAIAPLRYPGGGGRVSTAVHKPRPVGAGVTIALAALSALITFWLGILGHTSGMPKPVDVPDRVAVVRVQAGETLEGLAERVAPDRPAGQVMQRIRELNRLGAASVEAGQTLLSPIG